SRWVSGAVQQGLVDLVTIRRSFDQKAVISVDGQDISARCNRQAERSIEAATLRNCGADSGGAIAKQRQRDGGHTIVETVGHVEGLSFGIQPQARRSDDKRRRISSLREAGSNDSDRLQEGRRLGRNVGERQAHY